MDLVLISLDDVIGPSLFDEGFSSRMLSEIEAFECSRSPYHVAFLKEKAAEHSKHNTSKTYLLLDGEAVAKLINGGEYKGRVLAAFFTVGISSISPSSFDVSNKTRRKLGEHMFRRDGALGCYVIGELCRSDAYTKSQLPGSVILDECLSVVKAAQSRIGGRIVIVDSRESVLQSLYAPAGFRQLEMTELDTEDGVPLVTSFLAI